MSSEEDSDYEWYHKYAPKNSESKSRYLMMKDIKLGLSLLKNGLNYYGVIVAILFSLVGSILFILLLINHSLVGTRIRCGSSCLYSTLSPSSSDSSTISTNSETI